MMREMGLLVCEYVCVHVRACAYTHACVSFDMYGGGGGGENGKGYTYMCMYVRTYMPACMYMHVTPI